MLLIEQILLRSTPGLSGARLNSVVTALLLRADSNEARIALGGTARNRWKIDDALVASIFEAFGAREARLQLAKSVAFACLSPTTFRRLYMRLWRSRGSTDGWRQGMAWSLQAHLRRHPVQGYEYAAIISRQMRDDVEEIALLGLYTAGYLGSALSPSNARYLCLQLRRRSLKTMTALNALTEIYKRWAETPGPAKRVLSSQAVAEAVESLGKDENYRSNALYCIRAMEKALGRSSRRGRPTANARE